MLGLQMVPKIKHPKGTYCAYCLSQQTQIQGSFMFYFKNEKFKDLVLPLKHD